ncbi:DegQ family serine endoprotease [Aestuariirhabdus sp. Z084]|uniref:DegQ family serine endoprotease n=1 Tax=Aestuariirhabdus haliotis TaxID=2918751 RepID=UPI00201B433B|nr:DegQ family serine endoprotease [Aestuariirhabdus haliotis]MCL6417154.1 DegQ family serine endoprotease [Aestuariirhabdus haliotis]MCL6421114.1 DegQ family serine endoprotease [Aestuariirhabdus haliotis]
MNNYRSPIWALALLAFSIFWVSSARSAQLPEFTELVKKASPAVVNISTVQGAEGSKPILGPNGQPLPDIFQEFFGRPHPRIDEGQRRPQSLGSGFIISDDGYILTNNHVVDGASQVIVRLSDRRELEATLVGADERSDLALLKIDAEDLPVVKIGRSADLQPGQWVVAIGSPFGFDYSVTAGIVSALGRSLPSENYVPFIQTDVAINPGNSGGPLFNLDGEVIGINSQIFTRSGGFMGLSFAIPMDVAMRVSDQLKEQGYVSRGWLGVVIQDVNKDLAESFGLKKAAGALVAQVMPDGPGDRSGLRDGDVILSFAGNPINLSSDLPHAVGATPPGDKVKVELVRGGKSLTLDVTVGELPTDPRQALSSGKPAKQANRLGVKVVELTSKQKGDLEINTGVVISEVLGGPARSIGLRPGDVITDVDNQPVDSPKQFSKLIADLPSERSISMRLIRRGRPGYITFKLPE